jgi:hypothetical protein
MDEELAKRLALALAALCVRNTCIEDVHAGVAPSTQTGDHSDVKVVTPYGEIPWINASRISCIPSFLSNDPEDGVGHFVFCNEVLEALHEGTQGQLRHIGDGVVIQATLTKQ